jgi:hypothetical protein
MLPKRGRGLVAFAINGSKDGANGCGAARMVRRIAQKNARSSVMVRDRANCRVAAAPQGDIFTINYAVKHTSDSTHKIDAEAGVVQWQNGSFPSCIRGFDSLHPLQLFRKTLISTATFSHNCLETTANK